LLDAIVGVSLGLEFEDLKMIYRTQFPVMRCYDEETLFDANGRRVPNEIHKRLTKVQNERRLTTDERTWIHPGSGIKYLIEFPFQKFDRERFLSDQFSAFS